MATKSNLQIVIDAKNNATGTLSKLEGSVDAVYSKLKLMATVAGTAFAGFSTLGLKMAGDFESAEAGFRAILGSAEKASATMERIKAEAAATPFELKGLTEGTQALASITKDGDSAIDTLLDVGKAIATSGKGQAELDRVIMNLQQVASTGKVTEMDIRQFQGAIPIFNDILEASNLTTEELKESENSATLLFDAFKKAGEAGGITAGGFTEQAGTLNQLYSNAKDTVAIFSTEFVKQTGLFDLAKKAFENFSNFIMENKDSIINFANSLGDGIKNIIDTIITMKDNIMQVVEVIWEFVEPSFLSMKETLIESWQRIMEAIDPIKPELEFIAKLFGVIIVGAIIVFANTLAKVIEIVSNLITGFIEMFSGAIEYISEVYQGFFHLIKGENDLAVQAFKDAWEGLKTFFKGLFSTIYGVVRPLIEPIIEMINAVISGYNKIPGVGDINKIEIPNSGGARAVGGSVMMGRPYMVGERGPEMFVPSQSGRIENSPSGGSTVHIVNNWDFRGMVGDPEEFKKTVIDEINRKQELYALGAM
jgi:tape measure domain-containing protein